MREKPEVSDEVHASGGFGDVRSQRYMGRRVAVKTAKVLGMEDLQKMKKMADARREKALEEVQKTRKVGNHRVSCRPRRSQQSSSRDFTGKSFSGAHFSIRTSWNFWGLRRTWKQDSSSLFQSGWITALSWSILKITTSTDWSW